jgi:peptidyl-prolyl cis-trans isomerase D
MLKYFRNRKSLGYLVGSLLLLLVILAFVAFYIPDFMQSSGAAGSGAEVAWVGGSSISSSEFLRSYRLQESRYRQQLGAQYSPDLMRQLGFDNLVLRELVQNKILLLEAERQGISVSDDEVSKFIVNLPDLQTNGKFIGRDAYLSLLARNGVTASTFEEQLRQDLMRQKLQSLVTDGVVVAEDDVKDEYRRRNEKLHLEYAFFPKSDFESEVQIGDDEARRYYDENPKEFEHPIQRKVRFITLTPQLFLTAVNVNDREIERYYQQNSSRFEMPEQVQASHILLKTGEGKDETAVRKKAEELLARVKSGGDFAELARANSEDTVSAEKGGDLGFFGRGQMVPEFENAAFSLAEGQMSDLVRSTYGFHIIKVTARQAGMTQPLESVREQIRSTLSQEKARDAMELAVTDASAKLRGSGNIDALSAKYPLLVPQETVFFGRQERLPQLGNSDEASEAAFTTEVGKVSSAIRIASGYVFLQVLEERPAGVADFESMKERARAALRDRRLMELSRARAAEARAKLDSDGAEKSGIALQSTESFFRGGQLPEVGRSAALQTRAFDLPEGRFSEPLPADNGHVVARVVARSGFSEADFAAQKKEFEEQLLEEQRVRVWNAFVASLTPRYDVQVDWQAIRAVTG